MIAPRRGETAAEIGAVARPGVPGRAARLGWGGQGGLQTGQHPRVNQGALYPTPIEERIILMTYYYYKDSSAGV
jgi:hypothetical protein